MARVLPEKERNIVTYVEQDGPCKLIVLTSPTKVQGEDNGESAITRPKPRASSNSEGQEMLSIMKMIKSKVEA